MLPEHDVKDLALASHGKKRILWADRRMPVLTSIRRTFQREKPLEGITLAACLHVTTETANLARTLKTGGAEVFLCASNPLSTQDDVAASLVKDYGIACFSIKGEDHATYYDHIAAVLDAKPKITMDDGADVVSTLHTGRKKQLREILGGTEETTTGVIRLRSMAKSKVLSYPIVAVNDAMTKHLFDNRYGTGQSTMDGVLRATNMLIAGKTAIICGYGWCGRGVAMRAKGLGGQVVICEVDPTRALEATMDGYQVMPLTRASEIGDLFITVTGDTSVIRTEHFRRMKDGAVVCNSGHFNVELDLMGLSKMARSIKRVKELVDEYRLPSGNRIYVLGEGRLVNLAMAEGHPAEVMDMSFANQALCAKYLANHASTLEKRVYSVPEEIDQEIARLKLKAMGVQIDRLTPEQEEYLRSWQAGT